MHYVKERNLQFFYIFLLFNARNLKSFLTQLATAKGRLETSK